MGDLNCYFHKDRVAASKCDDCGKYICLECQYESSTSSGSTSIPTKICPYCKADKVENSDNVGIGIFVFIAFVFVFMIAIPGFSAVGGGESIGGPGVGISVFFIIFVIVVIIGTLVYATSQRQKKPNPEAEAIRAKAKKAIEESKTVKSAEEKHTPLYCKFCGAPIEANAKVCSYCGMNWIWKLDTDTT